MILQGGKELQRCLYAYAVKALLGEAVEIEAALLYPRIPKHVISKRPTSCWSSWQAISGQHGKT